MVRLMPRVLASAVLVLTALVSSASAGERLKVFVSILPQRYFVEQIGKDLVYVDVMVQPGANTHTYEPKPQQMVAISKTGLYFAIGATFEKAWLKRIAFSNPNMKVIMTDEGIGRIPMVSHHHEGEESHGKQGHGDLDPHIWLSPPLVLIQARNIVVALQEADPTNYSKYESNYRAFASMLLDLDSDLRKTFQGRSGLSFMVFHPAWGYFAHAYGLSQVPIEVEGKEPKPSQLQRLIQDARARNIRVIFMQPQFSARSAEQVAKEIGGQVVTVDPLALNWAGNLREVAEKFKAALR